METSKAPVDISFENQEYEIRELTEEEILCISGGSMRYLRPVNG